MRPSPNCLMVDSQGSDRPCDSWRLFLFLPERCHDKAPPLHLSDRNGSLRLRMNAQPLGLRSEFRTGDMNPIDSGELSADPAGATALARWLGSQAMALSLAQRMRLCA